MKLISTESKNTRTLRGVIGLLSLMIIHSGCELTAEQQEALEDAFDLELNEGQSPDIDVGAACHLDEFQQDDFEVRKKIDLLFVTDTSGSLNAERQDIADGIEAFVAELPSDVDYNIGVLLAHGSDSSYACELYRAGSEPRVLKSSEMHIDIIRMKLRQKMSTPPTHTETDYGEAGQAALNCFLDADNVSAARAEGFLREDAALAVVYVADENDLCSRNDGHPGLVPDPNMHPNGQTLEDYAYDNYCSRSVGGSVEVVNSELVHTKLRGIQGERPLLVSGILYNNADDVPPVGENELGRGYLQAIERAGGVSVDIGDPNIPAGLSAIGSLATLHLNLQHDFTLSQGNVDGNTIEAYVDGVMTPVTNYDVASNIVTIMDAGQENSVVAIHYCENSSGGDDPTDPGSDDPTDPDGDDPGDNGGDQDDPPTGV